MKNLYSIIIVCALIMAGCSDLLENDLPDNEIRKEDAIRSAEDMQEVLNAAYDVIANSFNGNNQRFAELLADNVAIPGNTGFLVQVYNRSSDFFNSDVGGYYKDPYIAIGRANAILENLTAISLSDAERNRFEGEAKFIRAMCHFEHVRLFAQPYGYTQDNSHLGIVIKTSTKIEPRQRNTVAEVYEQVIKDLTDAEALLPPTNGIYATSFAAKAYLARIYFQMNSFTNAAAKAEEVIANPSYVLPADINTRYGKTVSPEAIFATISSSANDVRSTQFRDSYRSINPDPKAGANNTADIAPPTIRSSNEAYALLTSNPADKRASWVAEKPYKTGLTKVFTRFDSTYFNVTHVSLSEMLLIAAESYGELAQNLGTAANYINKIKGRANVPLLSGPSAETVILEARQERRKEFLGEGNRVHDLKRIGVLGESVIVRGAPWDCNGMVLQFPASEQSTRGFVMNPQGGCN